MMLRIRKLLRDCRGATAVEYGLLLSCVVLILLFGLSNLGIAVRNTWTNTSNSVANAY